MFDTKTLVPQPQLQQGELIYEILIKNWSREHLGTYFFARYQLLYDTFAAESAEHHDFNTCIFASK
jgi:hypothetical protein